jgi:ribosomal protein S13
MKKKVHLDKKLKKKNTVDHLVSLSYNQFALNFGVGQNFISFFKVFSYFGVLAGSRIAVLFGVPTSLKYNILNAYHFKKIFKIIYSKFYFNYSYVKDKRFDLLKTLITFKMIRFYFSLPLRGQRTRTHAKTRKKYNII